MNAESLPLNSQNHSTRSLPLLPGPFEVFPKALHHACNRECLDKLIEIFRESALPGREHAEEYLRYRRIYETFSTK